MPQTLADKVALHAADDPDWRIADELNTPDAATYGLKTVDAVVGDARALLMTSGAWGAICLTAEDTTKPLNVRGLCITTRDAHLTLSTIRMTDPATAMSIKSMVDSLQAVGLISATTHDALLALGKAPASWADINNNGVQVTARDVGLARGAV